MRRQVLSRALLACYLMASTAHASTMELFGFGPRATALGNTAEAVADDYYATHANPANLALAKHIHFGFGTDVLVNRYRIDRQGGEAMWPTRTPPNNYLGHLGVSTPLPGWLQDRVALGFAVHLPLGGPTRLDSLDHRVPQLPLYDTLGDRLALVLGLGVKPAPWLAIGASMQVLTSLSGRADVALSPLDHRVESKALQVDLSTEAYPIVGATLLPRDDVRIALVWRSKSYVAYGLPLDVDVQKVGRLQFAVRGVGLWLPDTFATAGSWQTGKWLWTGGLAWQRWSQLPPLAPDVALALDNSQLLQPGSPVVEFLSARNQPIAMGAKDIVIPRLGAEFRPTPLVTVRGGVQYRPTPLPRATGDANYLDAPATTVGLGTGIQLDDPTGLAGSKPLTIDVSVGWTTLQRRTVVKLDPTDPIQATSVWGDSWHLALALHHDF